MARTRLVHHFTGPLLRLLEVYDTVAAALRQRDEPALRPQQVLDDMKDRLAKASEQALNQAGRGREADRYRKEEVDAARYAVVALLDDRFPALKPWWDEYRYWLADELYGDTSAGDRWFGENAEKLTPEQVEQKEIYAVVLGLGFRGRAGLDDDIAERTLIATRNALSNRLKPEPVPPEEFDATNRWLLPQPYEVMQPPPAQLPKERRWWPYVAALIAVCLLGMLAWWRLAPVDVVQITRERVAGLDCAALDVQPVPGKGRAVRVAGRVADDAGFQAHIKALARDGITVEGAEAVARRPRPFCEVLKVLEQRTDTGPAVAPAIALSAPDGRYQIGQFLHATVTPQHPAATNLTVLFVARESDVRFTAISLLPAASQPDGAVRPGTPLRVGRPEEEVTRLARGWRLDEPEGPAMAIAITTPQPLRPPAGPMSMPALLDWLRLVLPEPPAGDRVAASGHAMVEVLPATDPVPLVNSRLRDLRCASVRAVATTGGVRVNGRVPDRAALARRLEGLAGVDISAVRVVPEPLCKALDDLEPYAVFNRPDAPLPGLELPRVPPKFWIGEPFWLNVRMSDAFTGYLTLLSVVDRQPVVVLHPRSGQPGALLAAGSTVPIGHRGGGAREAVWRFQGEPTPYLLIAFATAQPLLPQDRPLPGRIDEALAFLQQALARQPGGAAQAYASYVMLDVQPGPGPLAPGLPASPPRP